MVRRNLLLDIISSLYPASGDELTKKLFEAGYKQKHVAGYTNFFRRDGKNGIELFYLEEKLAYKKEKQNGIEVTVMNRVKENKYICLDSEKEYSDFTDKYYRAYDFAKKMADSDSVVMTGMMSSLGGIALAAAAGLEPITGTTLILTSILHSRWNKKKRKKAAEHIEKNYGKRIISGKEALEQALA